MITAVIPRHYASERAYTVDILLGEILGLEYRVRLERQRNVELVVENKKKIVIQDHFFSLVQPGGTYLKKDYIPSGVSFLNNRFVKGSDIPVIYGGPRMEITDGRIICGIDIIASAFFMLSRWEEYVIKERDTHKRFPATASLAFKHHFLDRPVVNEYAAMLLQMLRHLGYMQEGNKQTFQFVLTHDVDTLLKWLDRRHVLRTFAGDIIKRRQIGTAFSRLKEYRLIRGGWQKDPFDTYDWLMDQSESLGLKSRFYFMSGGISSSEYDRRSPYPLNHPATREVFNRIQTRGHIIGFHPGYDSFDNYTLWRAQRWQLEEACGGKVTAGRQHYLRFQAPHTWRLWDKQQMEIDSTCGYADREGFRCGTGNLFTVFDILTREKLKLKEQPLIFMDIRNFFCGGYRASSPFDHNLHKIIEAAKTFDTPVTLLFHNASVADKDIAQMYEDILARARET